MRRSERSCDPGEAFVTLVEGIYEEAQSSQQWCDASYRMVCLMVGVNGVMLAPCFFCTRGKQRA
jgi:hypothetical protein